MLEYYQKKSTFTHSQISEKNFDQNEHWNSQKEDKKKKKNWLLRPTGIIFIIISILLF